MKNQDECINETIQRLGLQRTDEVVEILEDLWHNAIEHEDLLRLD